MISLALLLVSAVLLAHLLHTKLRVIKLAAKIPGHNGMPFVGILPEFLGAESERIFQIMRKYTNWPADKRVAKLWLGPELIVVVNSPECIQTVFNSSQCLERPSFYDFIDLKKGLLFGTVDIWRSHRRILDQAFTMSKLRTFVSQFDEKVKGLVAQLENHSEDVDIYSRISVCFLATFLSTTMEYDVDNCINNEFLKVHDRTIETIADRMSKVWLHSELANVILKLFQRKRKVYVNELLKYVDNIRQNIKTCCFIVNANDAVESKSDDREAFKRDYAHAVDKRMRETGANATLIKILEQSGFNDDEIEEELMTVILAAQDTTSLILSASILMLAMHKDVQQKAYEEVESLSQFYDLNSLSYDAVGKLQYTEMIIKETLRLFPVDHMTLRTTRSEIVLDGFRIPSGAQLVIPVFNIHRSERIWGEDANSFRPERFEDFSSIHPYAFIPFTGGSRICLGRKYAMLFMKTCLARLLLNYQLDTRLQFDEIKLKFSITLKLEQDYVVTLKRRERA